MPDQNNTGKVVLYTTENAKITVSVRFENETFWMTQKAIAELFDVQTPAIAKHLGNIYAEGELARERTVSKKEIVQTEGAREVSRLVEFHNLDAIIAVGYRVNSKQTGDIFMQFRIRQDRDYISNFDKEMGAYLSGEPPASPS